MFLLLMWYNSDKMKKRQTIQARWALGVVGKVRDKLISDILLWTPTLGHTSVFWVAKMYIHQWCADTRCCPEDLLIGMDYKRDLRESMMLAHLDDNDKHR